MLGFPASKLQAQWRGRSARRELKEEAHAATVMQARFRGHNARRELRIQQRRQRKATLAQQTREIPLATAQFGDAGQPPPPLPPPPPGGPPEDAWGAPPPPPPDDRLSDDDWGAAPPPPPPPEDDVDLLDQLGGMYDGDRSSMHNRVAHRVFEADCQRRKYTLPPYTNTTSSNKSSSSSHVCTQSRPQLDCQGDF